MWSRNREQALVGTLFVAATIPIALRDHYFQPWSLLEAGLFSAALLAILRKRYWLLTAHYRSPVDFTYNAVKAAQNAFIRLISTVSGYPDNGAVIRDYKERFQTFINDDLDLPKAIALTWNLLKDDRHSDADKRATILDFDRVFGLNAGAVKSVAEEKIPDEITALAEAREEARENEDWTKADALRREIESRGFSIKDTDAGFRIRYS